MTVSANYRELRPYEVEQVASDCALAWQDPAIPYRQYKIAIAELEAFRGGEPSAPFDAFIRVMRQLPDSSKRRRVLDVGASAGYYSEVLKIAGFDVDYTACDYSESFRRLAASLYPELEFEVADACSLPFHDDWFDVVMSGGALMHIPDYPKAIAEMVRVSSRYLIFHRTPVLTEKPTTAFLKDGYGVPMFEWHFNESELCSIFNSHGLTLLSFTDVFWKADEDFGHRTYLFEKQEGLNHIQV